MFLGNQTPSYLNAVATARAIERQIPAAVELRKWQAADNILMGASCSPIDIVIQLAVSVFVRPKDSKLMRINIVIEKRLVGKSLKSRLVTQESI